ncbi:hypothetical protein SAMN05443572_11460 [Myxococcus fulvus]|uniref:Uncharacterized protein n=1 Tax=Myxococcus fulvus TaxID=33 RepID=A0A511TAJ9_MYXFU|nr:hypothetical protein [Myxococcus fulvus]GEN11210.1 hypothetical protein MFU01_62470 [Myxococcus fulvus]SEU39439.1 hypothetical protein SAMN05443572_11460 [Myxococcus fulvus]
MPSYSVDIPRHLHHAYWRLPNEMRMAVALHLLALAELAPRRYSAVDGGPTRSDIAGLNAGQHVVRLGGLWFSYRISPQENLLRLLDFGDTTLTPPRPPAPPPSTWRHHLLDHDVWSNEGGSTQPPLT